MNQLLEHMKKYQRYHTKNPTLWTHVVGVPLVVFSLMIALGWVKLYIPNIFETNLSWLALFGLMIYYLYLDLTLGFITSVALVILCTIASIFSRYGPTSASCWLFLICFVAGWIFQFLGHFIEGRRPALFDNLSQALIAPLFVVTEILFLFGFRRDLKQALHQNNHKPE